MIKLSVTSDTPLGKPNQSFPSKSVDLDSGLWRNLCDQPHTQCAADAGNGVKAGLCVGAQGFVQCFAADATGLGDLSPSTK